MRPPAGWNLLTDPDLGWELSSPDNKIRLFLTSVKKGTVPRPPKDELSLGYRLSQVRSGSRVRTKVGEQLLPLEVGQGTAQIDGQKERGAILYFVVESSSRDVSGTALLRAGRSAVQEKALIASLRSIRKGK